MNRISFVLFTLSVLTGVIILNACKYEYVQESPVCFERDVQPIIISNCTQSGCHNSVDRESGRDYTTYDGVLRDVKTGNYKASSLYQVLVGPFGGSMPQAPYDQLTTAQVEVIATWIEEGATNDVCAGVACDTSRVISYAADVKPILLNNCNGCHGGTAQAGAGISLSSYNAVKVTVDNTSLYGSTAWLNGYSQMPKNGNQISDCNIAIIKKWIDAGAPNN